MMALSLPAFAETSTDEIQGVYDSHKAFLDKDVAPKTKEILVLGLLTKLESPSTAIRRAAARALTAITSGWIGWAPDLPLAGMIVVKVAPRLNIKETPDLGTRADLVTFAGRVSRVIVKNDPIGNTSKKLQRLFFNIATTDPESPVVDRSLTAALSIPAQPTDTEKKNLKARFEKELRPSVREILGMPPVSSAYEPVEAQGNLEALYAQAQGMLNTSQEKARNLAANVERDPKGPRVETSEGGWGQGPDPMDLLGGDLICTNDFGYRCGLALPGNGYAGLAGGWHHVTLILPKTAAVDSFSVRVYDYLKSPISYRLLACAKLKCGPSDWTLVAENKTSDQCTGEKAPADCRVQITFKALAARQLRLEVDDSAYQGANKHFWITGVEAREAGAPVPNG